MTVSFCTFSLASFFIFLSYRAFILVSSSFLSVSFSCCAFFSASASSSAGVFHLPPPHQPPSAFFVSVAFDIIAGVAFFVVSTFFTDQATFSYIQYKPFNAFFSHSMSCSLPLLAFTTSVHSFFMFGNCTPTADHIAFMLSISVLRAETIPFTDQTINDSAALKGAVIIEKAHQKACLTHARIFSKFHVTSHLIAFETHHITFLIPENVPDKYSPIAQNVPVNSHFTIERNALTFNDIKPSTVQIVSFIPFQTSLFVSHKSLKKAFRSAVTSSINHVM